MDLNEVTLQGRLATKPEVRQFDSGVRMVRLLITTRQEEPRRRVDVIPVSVWDISDEQVEAIMETPVGAEVWITGSIQRRFWSGTGWSISDTTDTRSRLEVIAHQVTLVDERLHDIVVYGEAG